MDLKKTLLPIGAVLALSSTAAAEPLNTWGLHPGKGVFGLTPYLYGSPSFGVQPLLYMEYGATEDFAMAGALFSTVARMSETEPRAWTADASFDGIELMPRYFVHPTTAIVGRVSWSPMESTLIPGLEVHGTYELTDSLQLTVNAQWAPLVRYKPEAARVSVGLNPRLGSWAPSYTREADTGASAGLLDVIVAPEWFFTEKFSAFVEVTPFVDLSRGAGSFSDRFSAEVVPGISFNVADEHFVSAGFGVVVTNYTSDNLYGGMYYSHAWGGEETPAEPAAEAVASAATTN